MSDKPVRERLQVKGDRQIAVVDAPEMVERAIGAEDARAPIASADVVLVCVRDRDALEAALGAVLPQLGAGAILWVAYPKLTSQLAGDLGRDAIRALAPAWGLDTVSQIAIDADWSALRLKRVAAPA